VFNVALSNSKILSGGYNSAGFQWEGGTNTKDVLISYRYVTQSFFETTGIEIIEGRGFSKNSDADSSATLISKSLAKMMGTDSAIGKRITQGNNFNNEVIGVVEDYLYGDMFGTSDPVLFFNYPNNTQFMYIKIKKNSAVNQALAAIEMVLKKHLPAYPFDYEFVDEAFDAKFKNEQFIGQLSQVFGILAILISCLGLFGLTAYTAEQRRKEIGVRKVLGASVSDIVKLLSKDFLKLVIISIVIAIPIAWYFMNNWLQGYTYRIEISWWVFAIAGFSAIVIAMLTVSFQAIKAAISNPVNSLRSE
ncbi:MAG: ABC transporter permease, partial [Kordia sp.]|uniref:ABC transporter permease n=1 Tax=Kordia sp. TaxID=1965332 RepID=UPI00385F384D